jgi:peptidoglycan/xylan/chitin deacetylase (PgdA/CDA1 family)
MGTTHDSSDSPRGPHIPAHRKPKRSLQNAAALLVLALPVSFLLFGGQWLAAAGLGPDNDGTRGVVEVRDLEAEEKMRVAKEETLAREAAAAEREAAAALAVPAYIPAEPMGITPGQTVVSLTFDDGFSGQEPAAQILSAAGLKGTFYLNSGLLDEAGSLTLRQAKEVALTGHEIAGHTFSHPDIDTLSLEEAKREICQDRENLLSMGFQVTNFAYPFASGAAVTSLVQECGYNTGRGLGGTFSDGCAGCPQTESLRPDEPNLLKAPQQVERDWTLADLQDAVTSAEAEGGWVILTFHGLCPYQCDWIDIDEQLFSEFATWLAERTATQNTVVRTVQEVIGGPLLPPVEGPAAQPVPRGENAIKNPDLEQWTDKAPTCWIQAGYGTNRAEFSKAPGAHGSIGARTNMLSHHDGDAKLASKQDLGACAPAVEQGRRYSLRASYTSDVRTQFSVHYRDEMGEWHFWVASPFLEPSSDFLSAEWTTPPVPDGAVALSFGLALSDEGFLVSDDYGLYDAEFAPPVPAAQPVPSGGAAQPGKGSGAG